MHVPQGLSLALLRVSILSGPPGLIRRPEAGIRKIHCCKLSWHAHKRGFDVVSCLHCSSVWMVMRMTPLGKECERRPFDHVLPCVSNLFTFQSNRKQSVAFPSRTRLHCTHRKTKKIPLALPCGPTLGGITATSSLYGFILNARDTPGHSRSTPFPAAVTTYPRRFSFAAGRKKIRHAHHGVSQLRPRGFVHH